MSEKASHHLPAKVTLVGGIAAAALHPESLAHDAPLLALKAPQPAAGLPHDPYMHPRPELPEVHHPNHKSHAETPVVLPTDITTKTHNTVHMTKPAPHERWTSRQPHYIKTPGVVTPPPKETKPPKLIDLHPESLTVPADIEATMHTETAYLPWMGCSGALVRNGAGQEIGFETAEHCQLRDNLPGISGQYTNARIPGSDGKYYISHTTPMTVETGDETGGLQDVGEADSFLLPASGDTTMDLALGAFKGHSVQEVLEAYNANRLSDEELGQLKLGSTMYLSGWPVYQPESIGKGLERQSFAMAVLGVKPITTTAGETIPMVLAAVPHNADGTTCSFGDSGGEGFVTEQQTLENGTTATVRRPVGTLSAFIDLTGKIYNSPATSEETRQYYEQLYGVDLSGMDAICGFSYEVPDTDHNGMEVQVVQSRLDILGYEGPISGDFGDILNYFEANFADPTVQKTVIDGQLRITYYTGKGGDDENKGGPGPEELWVDDPVLLYDKTDNFIAIGSYDAGSVNGLQLLQVYNNFEDIDLFATPDDPTVSLLKSTGEIQINNGGFVDAAGLSFGQVSDTAPDVTTPYMLTYLDGQIVARPRPVAVGVK